MDEDAKRKESAGEGGARSVTRALRMLHEVASRESGLTLSDVARSVELPVTTTARLLKTLEQAGYLVRETSGRYRAGAKILQIGAIALSNRSLYDLAEPYLQRISEFTGETAYLAVPEGEGRAVYLRQVESPRAIRHAMWTGRAIPAEGTALGAALAADLGEQKYACSRGTAIEPDAAAVAAPVVDAEGVIVAALSMIGPSFRVGPEDLEKFGIFVHRQAEGLARELRSYTS